MTTDNRTNEPTEAQIEAAAKAMWDMRKISGDPEWDELEYGVKNEYRKDARAALVAAQGAAPQAEAYVHCCNHTKCPGGSLCCCTSEQRLRDCWNQWLSEFDADAKQAFRDGYQAGQNDPAPWMAPVLPSSGVDEDKLAEVIARVTDMWDDPLDEVHDIPQIARAVAAWLEGQGGESRGE